MRIVIPVALILLLACRNRQSYSDITMKTTEQRKVGNTTRTSYTYSKLGDEYLQFKLKRFQRYYGVVEDINPASYRSDTLHKKWIELVDVEHPESMMKFEQPEDFLDFMKTHGYDQIRRLESDSDIVYTFIRK